MTRSLCDLPDCYRLKRHKASGLCQMHEHRRRSGHPLDAPPRCVGVRFERHFEKGPDCWEWMARIDPETGYGRVNQGWAHRVSYERYVGPIPAGMHLDHLCRNHKCVNPAHLEPVTSRENWLRGTSPTAIAVKTNVCQRGHEFTDENTYRRPDNGLRQCRECRQIRNARRYGRHDSEHGNRGVDAA